MFLDLNDKKGSNPLEIAAFLFGCLKPIWDSYRIRVKTCKITFKAMQGVGFKNMIFDFLAKNQTIECAFKTDLGDHVVNGQKTTLSMKSLPSIHYS